MSVQAPTPTIGESIEANLEGLTTLLGCPVDLVTEVHGPGGEVALAYLSGLTNAQDLKANLLAPVIRLAESDRLSLNALDHLVPETEPQRLRSLEDAANDLFEGKAVVFLSGANEALSYNVQGWAKHEPQEPKTERGIRGPREGFTETLDENIGMVRRWVKDSCLRADRLRMG